MSNPLDKLKSLYETLETSPGATTTPPGDRLRQSALRLAEQPSEDELKAIAAIIDGELYHLKRFLDPAPAADLPLTQALERRYREGLELHAQGWVHLFQFYSDGDALHLAEAQRLADQGDAILLEVRKHTDTLRRQHPPLA